MESTLAKVAIFFVGGGIIAAVVSGSFCPLIVCVLAVALLAAAIGNMTPKA